MKKFPLIRLCDPGSDKYDASECTANTMSLARYVRIIGGSVAMQSRKSFHFLNVSSVGLACLDANALSAGSNFPLIACAK